MITKITGVLVSVSNEVALLAVDAFEYSVLIPEFARRRLQTQQGERVSLFTVHYLEGNPAHGKLSPRLVGFLNENEREFFELFCSVDGVGVKKALRAMVRPVQEVATLIEEQDNKGLSALPGIGPATAERIVAKLRRKMPRFALLVACHPAVTSGGIEHNVVQDALAALCSLGHSEPEAHRAIETVLSNGKNFKDVESLLQAVYQQNKKTPLAAS